VFNKEKGYQWHHIEIREQQKKAFLSMRESIYDCSRHRNEQRRKHWTIRLTLNKRGSFTRHSSNNRRQATKRTI